MAVDPDDDDPAEEELASIPVDERRAVFREALVATEIGLARRGYMLDFPGRMILLQWGVDDAYEQLTGGPAVPPH